MRGDCYAYAPARWPECDRRMVPFWRDGRGGWACERCRTIIGPLDIERDNPPADTPGEWRDWRDLPPPY